MAETSNIIQRMCIKVVKDTAETAREAIRAKQGSDWFQQYEGNFVEEYTRGKQLSQDHLANRSLGIPPCHDSTGEYHTIIELLEKYGLNDEIIGLTFDINASNTGSKRERSQY